MDLKNVISLGPTLSETGKVLIMVHGRGATAQSILELRHELVAPDFTFLAPQAANHTWYPYGFMAPVAQNQPFLDQAMNLLTETVKSVKAQGVEDHNIFLLGFSQGACLTAEFAARNAQHFGGILLFTGGLIGQELDPENYNGDFQGTPILITTGDPDPHVPVSRVNESAELLKAQGAMVTKRIFPGRPHTILAEEIELANQLLSGKKIA